MPPLLDPDDEDEDESLPSPRSVGLSQHALQDQRDSEVYFAPTDPVVIGEAMACGFSPTSLDGLQLESSALDGRPGDEDLAEAISQELRTDAATSSFSIDVTVEEGVAYLRGTVADIDDVENVEEVAARLPQIAEVIEELEVGCS